MSTVSVALIVALATVLMAEFINGWTDAPNVVATVVSTGVLSPRAAIVMAVIMNMAGAMSGTAVASTVGIGIVDPSALTLHSITAAMLSIVAWGIFAARAGLPISKSHALLAGLAGAAFAGGGWAALEWHGWFKVLVGLGLSLLLGGLASFLIGITIIRLTRNAKPLPTKRGFERASVVAACFLAFNHGLNDGQKFMGVFATTLLAGGAIAKFTIPFWVIVVCAVTMAAGTSVGGWRIIRTIGWRMTRLQVWQGFAAQLSAGLTIFGASQYGVPLSTTHTITSAIAGAAASRRLSDIRWIVLRRIVLGWVITFPVCFVAAYAAASIER